VKPCAVVQWRRLTAFGGRGATRRQLRGRDRGGQPERADAAQSGRLQFFVVQRPCHLRRPERCAASHQISSPLSSLTSCVP
jgi:hypothetical protein